MKIERGLLDKIILSKDDIIVTEWEELSNGRIVINKAELTGIAVDELIEMGKINDKFLSTPIMKKIYDGRIQFEQKHNYQPRILYLGNYERGDLRLEVGIDNQDLFKHIISGLEIIDVKKDQHIGFE